MSTPEERPDYWFHAKKYGWGWGLPARWEGWAALLTYGAVMTGAGVAAEALDSPGAVVAGIVMLVATLAFLVICFRTGERPEWRWGSHQDT